MQIAVSFRSMRPRDEVRLRAEFLYSKLERFLDPAAEANLVVEVAHGEAVVDLVLHAMGDTFSSRESDADLRTALDRLFHTMEGQLRRAKDRRTTRRRGGPQADGFGSNSGAEDD